MRLFLLFSLLPLSLSPCAGTGVDASPERASLQEVSVEDLDWMAGTWRHAAGGGATEETWSTPMGGSLVGMFRWTKGERTTLFELMSIEESTEHGLVFRLRHFHPGLVPWESEKNGPLTVPLFDLGDQRAVFENPDSHERFVYERTKDSLEIRIQSDGEPLVFRLDRVE